MNEQNVKALFLNQYAGIGLKMKCVAKSFQLQNKELRGILLNDKSEKVLYLSNNGYGDFYDIDEWQLPLRSVSQLTDDEYVIIGSLTFPGIGTTKFSHLAFEAGREIVKKQRIGWSVYQYLQRIGVLTPFTYLNENNQPVTLQPDEIIAKGWAKLV